VVGVSVTGAGVEFGFGTTGPADGTGCDAPPVVGSSLGVVVGLGVADVVVGDSVVGASIAVVGGPPPLMS
jgi:hypothetical protein